MTRKELQEPVEKGTSKEDSTPSDPVGVNRRNALIKMIAAGGVATRAATLPAIWISPVVEQATIPQHAATSTTTTTTTPAPLTLTFPNSGSGLPSWVNTNITAAGSTVGQITVPADYTSMEIEEMQGGGGGGPAEVVNGRGGIGGTVTGTYSLSGTTVFKLYVGAGGSSGVRGNIASGGGGWGTGGTGQVSSTYGYSNTGSVVVKRSSVSGGGGWGPSATSQVSTTEGYSNGGGGGATAIVEGASTILAIAGGGGGAGMNGNGGNGGGTSGENGTENTNNDYGGKGGTPTSGGNHGTDNVTPDPAEGKGPATTANPNAGNGGDGGGACGGGGSGYCGGGGGGGDDSDLTSPAFGGGGGGSGYVKPGSGLSTSRPTGIGATDGNNGDDGKIVLRFS